MSEYLSKVKSVLGTLGHTLAVRSVPDFSSSVVPEYRELYQTWVNQAIENRPAPIKPLPPKEVQWLVELSTQLFILFEFARQMKKTKGRPVVLVPKALKYIPENLYVQLHLAVSRDLFGDLRKAVQGTGLSANLVAFKTKLTVKAIENPKVNAYQVSGSVVLKPRRTQDSVDTALNQIRQPWTSQLRSTKKDRNSRTLVTQPFYPMDWVLLENATSKEWPANTKIYAKRASDNSIVLRYFIGIPNVFLFLPRPKMKALLQRIWSAQKL